MTNTEPEYYVIGDIHGCYQELEKLIQLIDAEKKLSPFDTLIFLGDYIDRGNETFECLEFLLELKNKHNCIFLRGNHEVFLLDFLNNKSIFDNQAWIFCGGLQTLTSYFSHSNQGQKIPNLETLIKAKFPDRHIKFIKATIPYHKLKLKDIFHFFTHAQLPKDLINIEGVMKEIDNTAPQMSSVYWGRFSYEDCLRLPKYIFYSGHTPQNKVIDYKDIVLMDTGCVYGKAISAMNIRSRKIYTVAYRGIT